MRTRTNIDSDWAFYAEKDFSDYQVKWSPNELRLFGDIAEIGGFDGVMWSKAKRNLGPAAPDYDDSDWARVDLPHDWSITQPPAPSHAERNGFSPLGVLWYRKTIALPESTDAGRVVLTFDGAYRQATLFVNRQLVHLHQSGYIGFHADISDLVEWGGDNAIAVRLDATKKEGWFYEGAGIYRHVWLTLTRPWFIAQDGVFVRPEVAPKGGAAQVQIGIELGNDDSEPRDGSVQVELIAPDGRVFPGVSVPTGSMLPDARTTVDVSVTVADPHRWDVRDPALYQARVTLRDDQSEVVDTTTVPFGIRHCHFDPDRGFLLNGRPVKLKGVGNHIDHVGVGMAVPDRLREYRLLKLKEMGVNAYRCGHTPPAPEFLDLCDRMGILVFDENRLVGVSPEVLGQLAALIRRDRNHPSVICWSLGNEEMAIQFSDEGERVLRRMKRVVHRHDPSRPITIAINGGWGRPTGFIREVDVFGANYLKLGDVDAFHKDHPQIPYVLSEACSHVGLRGVYEDDASRNLVQAYDRHEPVADLESPPCIWPIWGCTAEAMWQDVAARDFVAGTFAWVGIDHRGEATPYNRWPCTGCNFGAMDACCFPKDIYWYYRAWWRDEPVLHVFPHWNWHGREGEAIDVWCFGNCDEVTLTLNDTAIGTQAMPRNGHIAWSVPYAPGELRAKGVNADGTVCRSLRRTTGPAVGIRLETAFPFAGQRLGDAAVINGAVVDADGLVVPDACHPVSFSVDGPARLAGVGNGDSRDPTVQTGPDFRFFHGLVQAILLPATGTGRVRVGATCSDLPAAEILLENPAAAGAVPGA